MEIHSVLPEERAKDQKGDPLPWGYRYTDNSRNIRQPEESGPFGRNRSVRLGSRASRTRTGTTPVRQKENSAVADFGRLFAKEQAKEEEARGTPSASASSVAASSGGVDTPRVEPEAVATECVLYGYAHKSSEWKVLSRFEKIVAPSVICEDYSREDPNLIMSNSPSSFSQSIPRKRLTTDALKKARIYRGGQHWIKVTFDTYQAAEKACFYSPVEIDGCMVHCEMWQGKAPGDFPIPKGSEPGGLTRRDSIPISRTVGSAQGAQVGKESALAGFERAFTLPRSHTMPDAQYGQPQDLHSKTSSTASSATAVDTGPGANLRSRSTPRLPSQAGQDPTSEYMTHIPSVKRAVLRPISEALPPQPSFTEKLLRSIPIVSWFVAGKASPGDLNEDGPILKDDGAWDEKNGWYWTFWHTLDVVLGSDFCGLKDD